jgi:hypothetical protein
MASKSNRISLRELHILSAIFARSNMGMGHPSKKKVERLKQMADCPAVDTCVIDFCQHFMESDFHEKVFNQEAWSWVKSLRKMRRTKIAEAWPDIAYLYWEPMETYKVPEGTKWPSDID